MSVGIPKEHVFIVDSAGNRIDSEELFNSYPDSDPRVLISDEIGKLLYVADLNLYFVTPLPNGDQFRQKITEIGSPRFGTKLVRHQIGSKVVSITADSVFHVRNEDHIIKVRAEKLQAGMVLESGEKVHW
jgi:hypothetical protein